MRSSQLAIFLDRDGVINENRSDYVRGWSDFVFLPGALEALRILAQTDARIIIVTNQSAVGRGLIRHDTVEEIHRRMLSWIAVHGGRVDTIYWCPHHPDKGCDCRKPKPGLALQAALTFGLALNESYVVGDAASDILMGQQLGCQTILVLTGRGEQELEQVRRHVRSNFWIARDLQEAAKLILEHRRAQSC